MAANSETGVLQPVAELAAACRSRGIALLVDAVQAAGKSAFDFHALGADLVAVSAHKVHGPKGVGALVVKTGARWKPPFPATHEGRRRAGTEPLPSIAGFAAAARAASALTSADFGGIAELRDRLERALTGALDGVTVNGTAPRVPSTSNLHFDGIDADRLLATLDRAGIDASSGSACSASSPEPSHVLLAMGRSRRDALSAVRFSLSRFTTAAEIDRAVAATIEAVETIRAGARR
jgi:cysteine desulfurase